MNTIGPVSLTVADLPRALAFYTERLGFRVHGNDGGIARLGAGAEDLLVLVEERGARPAFGTTGLFHFAVLLPSRQALALSLVRLVETRTPLQGASDHLVSEALYLADPEGNGIELYRDRPPEQWIRENGQLKMTTDPLDVQSLVTEGAADGAVWNGLPEATIIGHIHLRVAHIAPAERFYCDELGFDLTTRYGDMASFVSRDGYHHHIAFNTWGGVGAPPAPPGSTGLREFAVNVKKGTLPLKKGSVPFSDPSGNVVKVSVW